MEPSPITDRFVTLSIRRLAEEFAMGRETVSRRLANVRPAGQRQGHSVYRLKDAAVALLANENEDGSAKIDPDSMHPADRNAYFASELKRLAVETETRQLIPAAEFEAEIGNQLRTILQFLVTLPDCLERDVGLTGPQVTALYQAVDRQRAAFYAILVAETAEADQA